MTSFPSHSLTMINSEFSNGNMMEYKSNIVINHKNNNHNMRRWIIYWDLMVSKPISEAEFDDGWLLKPGKLLGKTINMSMNFLNKVCKSALHWICWDTVAKNNYMNNLRPAGSLGWSSTSSWADPRLVALRIPQGMYTSIHSCKSC